MRSNRRWPTIASSSDKRLRHRRRRARQRVGAALHGALLVDGEQCLQVAQLEAWVEQHRDRGLSQGLISGFSIDSRNISPHRAFPATRIDPSVHTMPGDERCRPPSSLRRAAAAALLSIGLAAGAAAHAQRAVDVQADPHRGRICRRRSHRHPGPRGGRAHVRGAQDDGDRREQGRRRRQHRRRRGGACRARRPHHPRRHRHHLHDQSGAVPLDAVRTGCAQAADDHGLVGPAGRRRIRRPA